MSSSLARVSFFSVQKINPRVFLSVTGQYFRHYPVLLCHRVFVTSVFACFWLGWLFADLGRLLLEGSTRNVFGALFFALIPDLAGN